jgi:hypothetical protein
VTSAVSCDRTQILGVGFTDVELGRAVVVWEVR